MPPGSIIQEKVVRPDVFEFYLQSHFPIKVRLKSLFLLIC